MWDAAYAFRFGHAPDTERLYSDPPSGHTVPIERIELPTPFPVGGVNAFFLDGAEPALVDTGCLTDESHDALTRAIRGRRVARVVITHGHVDHFGLAKRLQDDHGAEILVHDADARALARFDEDAPRRRRAYREGLERAGVPHDDVERLWSQGQRFDAWGQSVEPDGRLSDGDRLVLGDTDHEVMHAPGHTAGSIIVRSADRNHTFTGDTILPQITPNALSVARTERHALPTYLDTLRRLADEDLGVIQPGHRKPFEDHAEAIRRALRHAELRQGRLLTLLRTGPTTAYGLTQRLFHELPRDQLFLAVSEVLGHLGDLERRSAIERTEDQGIDRYAPIEAT